ncbi:hypothetical protein OAE07_03190 [Winogradskyella sp.]|nr:hypothetical protein [Winogradskyella sp.]MDC0006956.1 hypothetical protein [Winogradskyella sp.]MDC1504011.1 hypothetical protein [Winogradskyella sp.]
MKNFTVPTARFAVLLFAILFTSFSFSQTADFSVQHVEDNIDK